VSTPSIPDPDAPIRDPDDEFYTGCNDGCPDDCTADHRGEE